MLQEGQEIEVKVLDVKPEEHRLSLSIKALQEKGNDAPVEEDYTDSYQADNEDDSSFTLGDVLGDKLKELQDNE